MFEVSKEVMAYIISGGYEPTVELADGSLFIVFDHEDRNIQIAIIVVHGEEPYMTMSYRGKENRLLALIDSLEYAQMLGLQLTVFFLNKEEAVRSQMYACDMRIHHEVDAGCDTVTFNTPPPPFMRLVTYKGRSM
jgi:hypothetical protein